MSLSNPLKRGIHTSELAVVVAADVVLAAVPVLHGGLSPHLAVTLGAALNVAYVASRAVVKAAASLNPQVTAEAALVEKSIVSESAPATETKGLPAMPSQKTEAPAAAAIPDQRTQDSVSAPVEAVSTPTPAAPGA